MAYRSSQTPAGQPGEETEEEIEAALEQISCRCGLTTSSHSTRMCLSIGFAKTKQVFNWPIYSTIVEGELREQICQADACIVRDSGTPKSGEPSMNPTPKTCDREYHFDLIVGGVSELTSAVEDALFRAGCDDATVSMQHGRLYIEFSRSAGSLEDAINGAIHDVRKAEIGAEVFRVDE